MGTASFLIAFSKRPVTIPLLLYATQLRFNVLWPIWFFQFHWYLFAFFWLATLWILILAVFKAFFVISRKAAYLLLPYLIWTAFAGY